MSITTKTITALGTEFCIKIPNDFSYLFEPCQKELQRIENTYSRFKSDSQLSILNENLHSWQKITPEMKKIIQKALHINEDTYGYFDITIKAELERKGYDAKYSFVEKKKTFSIKEFFYSFFTPIKLKNNNVQLHKQIDFGGIGKGFAIDKLGKILQKAPRFFINGGGDILAKGKWDVELEHPDTNTLIGKITLHNQALCASSSNRRAWKNHHHLINPKTNNSANQMKGLFIKHKSAMSADAFATGLFASGFDLAKSIAIEQGLDVMLISDKVYTSKEFSVELYKEKIKRRV